MTEYTNTILKVSVHIKGVNPVYGENITHVSVDDECGGGFIVLEQYDDDIKPGMVRVNMDELEAIVKVARDLIADYEKAIEVQP